MIKEVLENYREREMRRSGKQEINWEVTPYRDKFGRQIECDELEVLLRDPEYKIVKQEMVGQYFVSTVWLGVPHGFPNSQYFETMVFEPPEGTKDPRRNLGKELECVRYEDWINAEKGHDLMVVLWKLK